MLTTYEQLQRKVLPYLEHYQTDLTHHDHDILEKYDGPFIYGYRRTGTDLVKLYADIKEISWQKNDHCSTLDDLEKILAEEVKWITYDPRNRNNKYLYFDGKEMCEKTVEQIESIYYSWLRNFIQAAKKQS